MRTLTKRLGNEDVILRYLLDGTDVSKMATLRYLTPSLKSLAYLALAASLSFCKCALRLVGRGCLRMPKRQLVFCSALSAARLASTSATSFPSMPTCPGVHLTESLMFG